MSRKRPKSLDAPVVTKARRLEAWAYVRADAWKKKYRYTLVNDFRQHITAAKNDAICGLDLYNKFAREKLYHYNRAQISLSLAESCMDLMITDEIGVMTREEWEKAAILIDEIRAGLARLVSSLTKGVGGSESPNFGTESASADYKDI